MSLTKVSYSLIDGAVVNVLDFDADPTGAADSTTAIQNAINYASNNNHDVVYLPAGKYKISTIYMTYDASLNPNFNTSKYGRITLKGAGKIPGGDYSGWTTSSTVIGTLIFSTAASTSAIVLSTAAQGTSISGFPNRQQVICDITVAGNTTAYVIENNGSPDQSRLENVAVIQQNATGNGILWLSSWYTYWRGVIIGTPSSVTSTGTGLILGSTLFAGLYNFVSCSFGGKFSNAVEIQSSLGSVNFQFSNCGFEACTNAGLYVSTAARQISLESCYFEGNGVNHININTASSVANLSVLSCFFYGNAVAASAPTGPFINLSTVGSADISNCMFFRPHTTLVYNSYDGGQPSGNRTTVRQCAVDTTGATYGGGAYFYCFDSNSQLGTPLLINNQITETAVVILINPSYYAGTNLNGSALRALSFGFMSVYTQALDVAFETDYPQVTTPSVRLYTTTAGGCAVQLPTGGVSTAQTFYLANRTASTQSVNILQVGGATLTTLTAGQAVLCIGDPNTSKWVALKTTFVD